MALTMLEINFPKSVYVFYGNEKPNIDDFFKRDDKNSIELSWKFSSMSLGKVRISRSFLPKLTR